MCDGERDCVNVGRKGGRAPAAGRTTSRTAGGAAKVGPPFYAVTKRIVFCIAQGKARGQKGWTCCGWVAGVRE